MNTERRFEMSALDRVIKIAEHEKISITAKGSLVYRLLKHDALIDAAKTELADLRTRIAELEALTQWQPIETAKDGDLVVLFGGVSYVTVGIVNKSVKKVMSLWTPIPKPPEEK